MSDKQSNLTDKEMEDLQSIVANTLASICTMADKHNIDRDSMLKYFADMLTTFAELASIQNCETSYTCNCKHNSNPRDDEPCCRCDSKTTNADRIRNMGDEELADILFDSCIDHIEVSSCERMFEKDSCKECVLKWLQSEAE